MANFYGTSSSETWTGSTSNETASGNSGNDTLISDGGHDTVYGGDGNDTLVGGRGTDDTLIYGGNDTLYGGNHNDVIWGDDLGDVSGDGAEGNDKLYGNAGNDTIYGGAGNDTIEGGTGNDTIYGGNDTDTVDYGDATSGVTINLATGIATGGAGTDRARARPPCAPARSCRRWWCRASSSRSPRSAIGSPNTSEPLRLTVVLPTAVSFSKVAQILPSAGAPPIHELTWRRCLPAGCFADIVLTADAQKSIRARSEPLHLAFKDAAERDVALPFSLRGLPQALDALAKEAAAR